MLIEQLSTESALAQHDDLIEKLQEEAKSIEQELHEEREKLRRLVEYINKIASSMGLATFDPDSV
jgi:predicted house-cleaning noncanonical NTP pyrophosphatase (MazG superfamily)